MTPLLTASLDILQTDPVAVGKWLAVLMAVGGIYAAIRRWEKTVTGKIEEIAVKQPVEVVRGAKLVTEDALHPVIHRVNTLENEVRVIRSKMDADKQEILARIDQSDHKIHEAFRSLERAIGRLEGGQHKP